MILNDDGSPTLTTWIFIIAIVVSLSIWGYRCNEKNKKYVLDTRPIDTLLIVYKVDMYDSLTSRYFIQSQYNLFIVNDDKNHTFFVKENGLYKVGDTLKIIRK